MLKYLIFAAFISSPALAKTNKGDFFEKDLPVDATTEIVILDYDPRLGGIFQGESVKEPGEGVFYTRAGDLSVAIKNFDLKKARSKPRLIIDKKFVLNKPLKTYQAPVLKKEE